MQDTRQHLIEYMTFNVDRQRIVESMRVNNGPLIVEGILQRANAKNQNGRIYPKEILMREAKRYENTIKEKGALGELDHPDTSIVRLGSGSHHINKLWWDGDDLWGSVEILSDTPTLKGTPNGNILAAYLQRGIRVGISSRGLGSVKPLNEDTVVVQPDFELICWDFVSNPSTQGGYMTAINESVSIKNNVISIKYYNINKAIDDILIGK